MLWQNAMLLPANAITWGKIACMHGDGGFAQLATWLLGTRVLI